MIQLLSRFLFDTTRRKLTYILLVIYLVLATLVSIFLYIKTDDLSFLNPVQNTIVNRNTSQPQDGSSNTETAADANADSTSSSNQKKSGTSVNSSSSQTPSSSSNPSSSSPASSSSSTPASNPPADESPSATVAFYADSQTDTAAEQTYHEQVVNYILARGANPVFHAGDLMEDGTQTSLDYFNAATATLRATRTFYAALGNNDRNGGDASNPSPLYLGNFTFPNNERWYSVNAGNLHMVILDSAFSSGSAEQLAWLTSDLQSAASQSRITGVMYHHPTFASSISSILRDNGVDFVIAGHIHSYSHSITDGIHYFTTTGQSSLGYFIAQIYSDNAVIKVYNSGNGLQETVSFSER